jgi:hypothetical protein
VLKSNSEHGHPCLVPDLLREDFAILPLGLRFVVVFLQCLYVEEVSFYSVISECCFYHDRTMRFLKTILVEMVIASLLKRFIRLLDFLT